MYTTVIPAMAFSSPKDHTKFKTRLSLSVSAAGSFPRPCSLKLNNHGRKFPTLHAFSGDGTGNGNGSGGSNGGDGSGGDGNEKEALIVSPEGGRCWDSIPEMFLKVETSPFSRWVMQLVGIKKRLLGDDLVLECVVGMLTKAATESEKRKEKFSKELETVYADVRMMAVSEDFMLANLCGVAPLKPANFLAHNSPGTVVTITLINTKRRVRNKLEDIFGLSPSVGCGLYVAVSSNLRYQLLAGFVARRPRKPLLHKHKKMVSAVCNVQVLIESQPDCWIPLNISLHLTGGILLRNWCISLMRSQGRYINEFRIV